MRLFIAIPLDGRAKLDLIAAMDAFRSHGIRGNYTKPENLHITLAFIGEYNDPDRVLEVMESIPVAPLFIKISGIGSFGDHWWAGVDKNEDLELLVKRLRRALSDAGIPFDPKTYIPHVTLLRKPVYDSDVDLFTAAHPKAEMLADSISLMRSTPGKNGMIYTEIGTVSSDQSGSANARV